MIEQTGSLGTAYKNGELIIRQGDLAETMYVVQEGQVEVVRVENGVEVQLFVCGQGQFVGLSALFDGAAHQANVRALGPARLITVQRKNLLRRIQEDASLAFHIIEVLSNRNHKLAAEITHLTISKNLP